MDRSAIYRHRPGPGPGRAAADVDAADPAPQLQSDQVIAFGE